MRITIETMLAVWNDEVVDLFIKLLTEVAFATDEASLTEAIKRLSNDNPQFDKNFFYGYGGTHFYIHQRPNRRPNELMTGRLAIVEF